MTHISKDDDAFADRIAKGLRAPERVDGTFEVRTMSAVRASQRVESGDEAGHEAGHEAHPSWWVRPRSFSLTPLAALAIATGLAAILLVGNLGINGLTGGARGREARAMVGTGRDTVHIVRFMFVDSTATRVALVGAFNQWQKDAVLLRQVGTSGVWSVDVALVGGRYEYAFVVSDRDGERWVADRFAVSTRDEFGTETSLISLPAQGS